MTQIIFIRFDDALNWMVTLEMNHDNTLNLAISPLLLGLKVFLTRP